MAHFTTAVYRCRWCGL